MQAQTPTALVVEDDAALRMLVRVNLELEGFVVAEAGTLDEAEAALARSRPDVVLLDVHLDGRETLGLLARLRAGRGPGAAGPGVVGCRGRPGRARHGLGRCRGIPRRRRRGALEAVRAAGARRDRTEAR